MPHKSFSVHAGELARLVPPALAGVAVLLTACASGPGQGDTSRPEQTETHVSAGLPKVMVVLACTPVSLHGDAARNRQGSRNLDAADDATRLFFAFIPENGFPKMIGENADAAGFPLDRTQSRVLTGDWPGSPYAPDNVPGDSQYFNIVASGKKADFMWKKMMAKAIALNNAGPSGGTGKPIAEAIAAAGEIDLTGLFDGEPDDDFDCPG